MPTGVISKQGSNTIYAVEPFKPGKLYTLYEPPLKDPDSTTYDPHLLHITNKMTANTLNNDDVINKTPFEFLYNEANRSDVTVKKMTITRKTTTPSFSETNLNGITPNLVSEGI